MRIKRRPLRTTRRKSHTAKYGGILGTGKFLSHIFGNTATNSNDFVLPGGYYLVTGIVAFLMVGVLYRLEIIRGKTAGSITYFLIYAVLISIIKVIGLTIHSIVS